MPQRIDDDGTTIEVLEDGRVRINPSAKAPIWVVPVTFSSAEWDTAVRAVQRMRREKG